jgi:WD40 repeat protein
LHSKQTRSNLHSLLPFRIPNSAIRILPMFLPRLPALFLCALLLIPSFRSARADDPEVAEFKARAGNMSATAISNDGKRLLTGEDDGLVTLWDVESDGTAPLCKFEGHFPRAVFACALLPGGTRGVTCGDDNTLIVWDLETGHRIRRISTVDSIPLVLSCNPDGTLAATGCNDGQIYIWNLATGKCVATLSHKASLCSILFSPNGRQLAAGYSDGHVILWDTSTWSAQHTLPDADQASVGALAFSPDSRLLATGNQNGGGFVWTAAAGSAYSTFAGYANPEASPSPPVAPVFPGSTITPENRSSIEYLCFNPNGSMLLGSLQDAIPRFWDSKTGHFLGTADWFADNRFYIARFGFTFATAAVTPKRDLIVLMKENLAEVFRCPWTPNPPQQ